MGSWLVKLDQSFNRVFNRAKFLFTGIKAPPMLRPMTKEEAFLNGRRLGLKDASVVYQYIYDYTSYPCVPDYRHLKY